MKLPLKNRVSVVEYDHILLILFAEFVPLNFILWYNH